MSIYELESKLKNNEKVICPKCGSEWYIVSDDVLQCKGCNSRMIKHKRINPSIKAS